MSEVIKRELYAVRRDLNAKERKEHEAKAKATFEAQKRAQSALKSFRDFAQPLIRVSLDPTYTKGGDQKPLGPVEARALRNELDRRTKHKSAEVARLKAEREFHLDAAANGYFFVMLECELHLDDSATQVRYLVPGTGEVVHQRVATGTERQMSLPDDELPDAPPKKKRGRRGARGAVQ